MAQVTVAPGVAPPERPHIIVDQRAPVPFPLPSVDFGSTNLLSTTRANLHSTDYPYRAVGRLFFKVGQNAFFCSASLIKKGLIVTAGHCVTQFGAKSYYSDWQFVPGYRDGSAPYGIWTVAQAYVLTSYFDGTDSCQQKGVVCQNDMALLVLNPQKGKSGEDYYVGTSTGWLAYGWGRTVGHFTENHPAWVLPQ
jgi:V8-like Glu-specific endopeptidase